MLEQSVEQALKDIADLEQPHPRVSIQQAIEQGHRRLRHRSLVRAVGTPVLAASAALALVLTGTLPWSARHNPQAAGYGAFVQGAFNPARLTIGFGWLPKGTFVLSGETSTAGEALRTYGPRSHTWTLAAYARAMCHLSSSGGQFQCQRSAALTPVTLGPDTGVAGPGPAINGHRSFWLAGGTYLAWEYGPDAWAELSRAGGTATALRIARAATIGPHVPSAYGQQAALAFAARFTSIPPGWRIINAGFARVKGRFEVLNYTIARLHTISPPAGGAVDAPDEPFISVSLATNSPGQCGFSPSSLGSNVTSGRVTIHGYRFTAISTGAGQAPYLQLCGVHDGLAISVAEWGASQHFSPTDVMERLELLGPKPDGWVTNPLP